MAEGRWDPSFTMRDLAAACKPHWALLSTNPDLLEPYFKKANEFNRNEREGRLDCIGRPLKDLEMEISRIEKKWVDMEREISDTVRNTSPKELKRKVFFVAHFNHLSEGERQLVYLHRSEPAVADTAVAALELFISKTRAFQKPELTKKSSIFE